MINNQSERVLKGIGVFRGPAQNTQFNQIVELIKVAIPHFVVSAQSEQITNENGLNRKLARFITSIADNRSLPYVAYPESMEDESRGDSPATDFGIHLKVDDISVDQPLITKFEGKRLSKHTGIARRREYVVGHEKDGKYMPCGGIERFKRSIHGRSFRHAGMIGYIQDGSPTFWLEQINSWISELADQITSPSWSADEQLRPLQSTNQFSETASIVKREADQLHLTHLWVSLVE